MAKDKTLQCTASEILLWVRWCPWLIEQELPGYIKNLVVRGQYFTAKYLLQQEDIPVQDRLWLACRKELIPVMKLHEFAIWCAEGAFKSLKKYGIKLEPRSIIAVETRKRWLRNKATWDDLKLTGSATCAASIAAWCEMDQDQKISGFVKTKTKANYIAARIADAMTAEAAWATISASARSFVAGVDAIDWTTLNYADQDIRESTKASAIISAAHRRYVKKLLTML